MIELHPQILEKNGKKEFVVLPFKEFVQMEEQLMDYDDLRALRAAKKEERDTPAVSLAEIKAQLES